MHGFIVIDKPAGISSFQVVRQIRRLFSTKKVGHAGTLDPLATGVLPVALGEATKVLQYLLDGDKEYQAEMTLGVETDTQDSEGRIVSERPWNMVTKDSVLAAAASYVGDIEQVPPMYSALKRDGVPLYRLAREGIEVEREKRKITIKSLDVTAIDLPRVAYTVQCSKGTYVRTLSHDIGNELGCGAHLTALRRTASAGFNMSDTVTLAELEEIADEDRYSRLLPLTSPLSDWQQLEIDAPAFVKLRNGIPPTVSEVSMVTLHSGEMVFFLHGNKLQALARFVPERTKESRGDFELIKVFNLP